MPINTFTGTATMPYLNVQPISLHNRTAVKFDTNYTKKTINLIGHRVT